MSPRWMLLLWVSIVQSAGGAVQPGAVVGWGTNGTGPVSTPFSSTNVIAVAAGRAHALALTPQGTVLSFGDNSFSQSTPPDGLSDVVRIAAGRHYSLALLADGTVSAWGANNLGQTSVPEGLANVTAIAAGVSHSLALKKNGKVVGWGANHVGQATAANLSGIRTIAAGRNFSLALRTNGTVVAWGDNTFGQLNVPAGLTNVIAIAAGELHGLALRSNGRVIAWPSSYHRPMSGIVAISAGYDFSMALASNGTVVAWARNGSTTISVPEGLTNVVGIEAGDYELLALTRGPFIAAQPRDVTTREGDSALFFVKAAGLEPLSYQWSRNGTLIPGATHSTFVVSRPQHTDAANFSVTLSNAYGSITSRTARLEVITDPTGPTFTKSLPPFMLLEAGTSLVLAVEAGGLEPIGYQWYFESAPLPGEVGSALVITNAQTRHAGLYSVVASNIAGRTTNTMQLIVFRGWPRFTQEPTNVYAIPGTTARFHADANGAEPLSYQWRFQGLDIAGATSPVLTLEDVQREHEGQYSVTVRSGDFEVSSWAELDVASLPDFEWARGSGTLKRSAGEGIALDVAGNIFVTGYFSGTGLFGDTNYSAEGWDIFVAKFDATGQLLWTDKWGTPSGDYGRKVVVDAQGNACVIGTFWNGSTNDPAGFGLYSHTFISKYDPVGSLLWRRNIRGQGVCAAYVKGADIAIDKQGNLFVTGQYLAESVDFGTTNVPHPDFNCTGFYVAKYSPNGALVWVDLRSSSHGTEPAALACDSFGDVFVTGRFAGTLNWNGGSVSTVENWPDIFVARYTSTGGIIWVTNAGGPTNSDRGLNIAVDAARNAYVSGHFSGVARFGDTNLTVSTSSSWGSDAFIAKYDSQGQVRWVRQITPSSSPLYYPLQVTASGYTLFAGQFYGPVDFGGIILTAFYRADTCIASYDPEGKLLWARQLDDQQYPMGNSTSGLALDANGNAFLTGWFGYNVHFGPTQLTSDSPYEGSYGPQDCFIAKIRDAMAAADLRLRIARSADHQLTVSWPTAAAGFGLEMLHDFNNAAPPVPLRPTGAPDRFTYERTVPVLSGTKFFRLVHP